MESITLSDYLTKNSDSKKVQKRIARAIKTYRHAARDLAHATADVEHAKEDCLHAMQMFDAALEDCTQDFAAWPTVPECDSEEIDFADLPEASDEEEDDDDAEEEEDLDEDDFIDEIDSDEHPAAQADKHLEHAAKDFSHAIADAECVLEELSKVENLLFEIIDLAEEDGFQIDLAEAKAYVVAQAAIAKTDEKAAA